MANTLVQKRDDQIVPYDESNIARVIKKAAKTSKEVIADSDMNKLTSYVTRKVSKLENPVNVESIQNAVEESLMKYNFFETEKVFHDFRKEHEKIRFRKNETIVEMNRKLNATNIENSNANLDEKSFGGRKGSMASSYLKEDALDYRMPEEAARSHRQMERYKHDADAISLGEHNCDSIPIDDCLKRGMKTRQVYIRPVRSIGGANQVGCVTIQLQSLQQFGGVSFTHWDWTLVPYFRMSLRKYYLKAYLKSLPEFLELNLEKIYFEDREDIVPEVYTWEGENGKLQYKVVDKVVYVNRLDDWVEDRIEEYSDRLGLKEEDFYIGSDKLEKRFYQAALFDTIQETKQGSESFLHNLNSLQSRSGNQLPFSSINYGTCTLPEGRIIIKSILDCTIEGVGNGQTSIFPCQIFQLGKGINRYAGDPNYDLYQLALKSSATRMYPNYGNVDWSVDKAGFVKSQTLKAKVLSELDLDTLEALKKLPKDVQLDLGFVIEDDGKEELTIIYDNDNGGNK